MGLPASGRGTIQASPMGTCRQQITINMKNIIKFKSKNGSLRSSAKALNAQWGTNNPQWSHRWVATSSQGDVFFSGSRAESIAKAKNYAQSLDFI
jgi:hypothetical protein